jgi:hypothetical protein
MWWVQPEVKRTGVRERRVGSHWSARDMAMQATVKPPATA